MISMGRQLRNFGRRLQGGSLTIVEIMKLHIRECRWVLEGGVVDGCFLA